MVKTTLFFFMLSLLSCQKYSQYEQSGGRISIVGAVPLSIESAEALPWRQKGEQKDISRGILVKFGVPLLRDEHIEAVFRERGVDSWIVKISRRDQNFTMEDLGLFYAPNFVKRGREQKFYPRNFSYAYFQVLYTATLMNQRMMEQNCPSMGHNKGIPRVTWFPSLEDIKSDKGENHPIWVVMPSEKIMRKVHKVELIPVAFDGGRSLVGEYFIDLALYNTKEGHRYSDYARVGTFQVPQEIELTTPSCIPTDHRKNPIKKENFRFGR